MIHPNTARNTNRPAKGNTIMSATQNHTFKEIIDAARGMSKARIDTAQQLVDSYDAERYAHYLRDAKAEAAAIEHQITLIERMATFFAEVSA
jgi:hypothetical protein